VSKVLLSAIRTTIIYFAVTLTMRLMGKRQVGELQPYELVITVLIAELAAIPVADTDIPLLNGVIPIVILLVLQVLLSEITLRSEKAREVICGRPSILIAKGQIQEQELRRLRINLNDLLEQLRNKDYPNVADVHYAILETNGQLSLIPKVASSPPTVHDLRLQPPEAGLPITLILDGQINYNNLRLAGISIDRLKQSAQARGIAQLKDVFFANVDETGSIHMQAKDKGGGR
jgi:uncharacterized membrane protein YcaP (DUF421 family)